MEPTRVRKDARALDRVDDLEALREDRRDRLVANLFRDRLKHVRDLGPLHLRARADRGLHRSAVVRADERRSFEFRDVLDADLQRGLQRFEDRRRLRARKVLELSIGAEEPVRELLAVAHGLAIREVFQDRLEVHALLQEVSKVSELRHVPHLRQDVFPVLLRAAVDGDVCLPRLRDREFALPQKAVDLASLRRLRLWMDDLEDVFQLHLTVAVILRQLVRIEVFERLGESSLQRVAQHALLGLIADVTEEALPVGDCLRQLVRALHDVRSVPADELLAFVAASFDEQHHRNRAKMQIATAMDRQLQDEFRIALRDRADELKQRPVPFRVRLVELRLAHEGRRDPRVELHLRRHRERDATFVVHRSIASAEQAEPARLAVDFRHSWHPLGEERRTRNSPRRGTGSRTPKPSRACLPAKYP